MKATVIMHNGTFYRVWNIPESGISGGIPAIEYAVFEKLTAEIAELTAKLNFMTTSAQQNAEDRNTAEALANKYMNYYSAESVTTRVLSGIVDDLQTEKLELWGLNSEKLLAVINFYEATTGLKAMDIK